MKTVRLVVLSAVAAAGAAAQAGFHFTEASFLAATNAGWYLEEFTTTPPGYANGDLTYDAPGANGFDWAGSTAAGGTPPGNGFFMVTVAPNGQALSTGVSGEEIVITFTGNPVTAVGGFMFSTDLPGAVTPTTITLNITDGSGSTTSVATSSSTNFIGYTTLGAPITSISIDVDDAANDFVTLDHFYTGTAVVPEPATLAALGAGLLALRARRRKA